MSPTPVQGEHDTPHAAERILSISYNAAMIPDAIKSRPTASPFKPFVLKMGSRDTYTVNHPELVSVSPGGRRMILWTGEEQSVDLDVLLVEPLGDAKNNGHGRRRSA